jgi:hypothetical protein
MLDFEEGRLQKKKVFFMQYEMVFYLTKQLSLTDRGGARQYGIAHFILCAHFSHAWMDGVRTITNNFLLGV